MNIVIPAGSDVSGATITLTDLYGRPLKKLTTVGYSNSIYLSGLAAGVYLLQIVDGKRSVISRKIVKL